MCLQHPKSKKPIPHRRERIKLEKIMPSLMSILWGINTQHLLDDPYYQQCLVEDPDRLGWDSLGFYDIDKLIVIAPEHLLVRLSHPEIYTFRYMKNMLRYIRFTINNKQDGVDAFKRCAEHICSDWEDDDFERVINQIVSYIEDPYKAILVVTLEDIKKEFGKFAQLG